jgi:methionine sulfoxide reductase heme-binding subunit
MNNKLKINFIGIIIIILVFLIDKIISDSYKEKTIIYISSFGFLALISIMFVLAIPVIYKLKKNEFTTILLTNRRWIGIYTFIFALIHVLLVSKFLFYWNLSWIIENPYIIFGIISFLILILMAATSNDTSMKILGKNWKILHYFIYLVLVLIIIHSFKLGSIFMKSLFIKILVALLALIIIVWKIKNKSIKSKNN